MPATVLDYWFGADRADALRHPARARLWWRKDPVPTPIFACIGRRLVSAYTVGPDMARESFKVPSLDARRNPNRTKV